MQTTVVTSSQPLALRGPTKYRVETTTSYNVGKQTEYTT
jgi:hypothetical protein